MSDDKWQLLEDVARVVLAIERAGDDHMGDVHQAFQRILQQIPEERRGVALARADAMRPREES